MVYAVNESGWSHAVEEYTGWEYGFKAALLFLALNNYILPKNYIRMSHPKNRM
jgi:hypothetical protein